MHKTHILLGIVIVALLIVSTRPISAAEVQRSREEILLSYAATVDNMRHSAFDAYRDVQAKIRTRIKTSQRPWENVLLRDSLTRLRELNALDARCRKALDDNLTKMGVAK